jgi:hypothetical protein
MARVADASSGVLRPWNNTSALALVAPGSSEGTIQTISPDSPYGIFSPYRLATRPGVAPPATATAFSLPDVSSLVVVAAPALMAVPLIDLSARYFERSTNVASVAPMPVATPTVTASPLKLPGPFHVFVTTGPGSDASAMGAANGMAGGNGNGSNNGLGNGNAMGSNAGGNGQGNGLANAPGQQRRR